MSCMCSEQGEGEQVYAEGGEEEWERGTKCYLG